MSTSALESTKDTDDGVNGTVVVEEDAEQVPVTVPVPVQVQVVDRYAPIEQCNGDLVFMAEESTELCVVVHHNGVQQNQAEQRIRKLNRFTFHLRYWKHRIGDEFVWANKGVMLDIFDYCDIRKYMADLDKAIRPRSGLCYDIVHKQITEGLVCTTYYEQWRPVSLVITRAFKGLPKQLQAVDISGTGYKKLRALMCAALAHVHTVAGVPYENDPDFFWPPEWTDELCI